MADFIYTANMFKISFSVPSVGLDSKSWDKFSGAGHTMDTQNFAPGGMEGSIATGGVSKRNPATIERVRTDYMIGIEKRLDGAVGSACSIGVQAKSDKRTAAGAQRTYTGIVREVNPPDQDSESSSAAMYQVVVELNEDVA